LVAPYEGPNGEKGAYIDGVAPGDPAERAGLRIGYIVSCGPSPRFIFAAWMRPRRTA